MVACHGKDHQGSMDSKDIDLHGPLGITGTDAPMFWFKKLGFAMFGTELQSNASNHVCWQTFAESRWLHGRLVILFNPTSFNRFGLSRIGDSFAGKMC